MAQPAGQSFEVRTAEQIREHYEVERKLADRLRQASKGERRSLYTKVYEDLFRLVPTHPQLVDKIAPERRQKEVATSMRSLAPFLGNCRVFLEIGPGDCALSFEVAKHVPEVVAVDVSETITRSSDVPDNFRLILSDGSSIPVPEGTVDVVYSDQLMEHLHPDDAQDQLGSIFNALTPGGSYLCVTPNRLNGPHDISEGFDQVASGFHLMEYTVAELCKLFKESGFSKVVMNLRLKGRYFRIPVFPAILCETVLKALPRRLRLAVAKTKPVRILINVNLVASK